MTLEEKQSFKALIDDQIAALGDEITTIQAAIYPDREAGTSDKVAHIAFKQEQSIHFQRYEEAVKRLNRLKHAYRQIDTPSYGICQECEEPIPLERLQIAPESIYCVECMNEMEE